MNEVMFVTGGELLQFLPISSKKRVGMKRESKKPGLIKQTRLNLVL